MSIKEKKEAKKTSKGGIIAAVLIILFSALDGVEGDGTMFAGIIFVVISFFALIAIIGAVNKKKKNKSSSAVNAERKKPIADAVPKAAEPAPQRKYYDSDCQKLSSEHDHNRRLEQLDGFLANGIISRAEYEILKLKYMR